MEYGAEVGKHVKWCDHPNASLLVLQVGAIFFGSNRTLEADGLVEGMVSKSFILPTGGPMWLVDSSSLSPTIHNLEGPKGFGPCFCLLACTKPFPFLGHSFLFGDYFTLTPIRLLLLRALVILLQATQRLLYYLGKEPRGFFKTSASY